MNRTGAKTRVVLISRSGHTRSEAQALTMLALTEHEADAPRRAPPHRRVETKAT